MSTKKKLITAYLVIGLLFAIYGWLWGTYSYKGFFYNLGIGFVWPTVLFPSLGKVLGAIILVLVIAAITML